MIRKRTKMWILVVIACTILFTTLIIYQWTTPDELDFPNNSEIRKNYNHYDGLSDSHIDWNNGWIVHKNNIFKTTLKSKDSSLVLHFVEGTPQLTEHYLYYSRFGTLIQRDIVSQEETVIAKKVSHFIVRNDKAYYLSRQVSTYDFYNLVEYDLTSASRKTLHQNVYSFYLYQDKVYILTLDDQLIILDEENTSATYSFDIPYFPFTMQFAHNFMVYEKNNRFFFTDLETLETNCIALTEEQYVNHFIEYVCNDDFLYASFQGTKTDGSLISNIEHEANGVWCLNLETMEKEKISDECFERLLLFNNDLLLAFRNGKWFQIDPKNGNITEL